MEVQGPKVKVSKLIPDVNKYLTDQLGAKEDRCTGKSTAEALRIISEAMSKPGVLIPIIDKSCPRVTWQKYFIYMVEDLIVKLELKHLTVNTHAFMESRVHLVYDIYDTYVYKPTWSKV